MGVSRVLSLSKAFIPFGPVCVQWVVNLYHISAGDMEIKKEDP
jgi:hypothetical protein